MNLEELEKICKKLPGVTQDVKWGNDLCFSVGNKMFLVAALDQKPTTASFKVGDDQFDEMAARPGFKPAPYMAKHKWIWLEDINLMGKNEWAQVIEQSYELVKQKLPKKIQEQLRRDL